MLNVLREVGEELQRFAAELVESSLLSAMRCDLGIGAVIVLRKTTLSCTMREEQRRQVLVNAEHTGWESHDLLSGGESREAGSGRRNWRRSKGMGCCSPPRLRWVRWCDGRACERRGAERLLAEAARLGDGARSVKVLLLLL